MTRFKEFAIPRTEEANKQIPDVLLLKCAIQVFSVMFSPSRILDSRRRMRMIGPMSLTTHKIHAKSVRNSGSRGFTLIELLVGIVILVVLASVSLAVASRAIGKARAASCMSNMRQIGGLMNGYAAENHGYYPPAGKPVGYVTRLCEEMFPEFPSGPGTTTADREKFFISGSGKIFICPADKKGLKGLEKSYLANGRITGVLDSEDPDVFVGAGTKAFTPKPIAKIKRPSRALLLVEGWDKNNRLWNANDVRYTSDALEVVNFDAHHGGRHYLFVDGHVEWLSEDPGRAGGDSEEIYYFGRTPGI